MIDLYSSATPNGRKISIMLEELGVQYNAIHIDLEKKEQFSNFFSKISPSNKIPVIVDNDEGNTVFESGAILLYLAEKYGKFLNKNCYWEIVQWLFFQMSYVGPMLGQAHQYLFYNAGKSKFAEEKSKGYTKHVYQILDERLSSREYIVDEYSIADISIWPWIRLNKLKVPVINPVKASLLMAESIVKMNISHSKLAYPTPPDKIIY